MRGLVVAIAVLAACAATAWGQDRPEDDHPPATAPPASTSAAAPDPTDDTEPAEPRVGDTVTLKIPRPLRVRGKRRGIRVFFVIASRTLDDYKELDAFVGPRGHLVADPDHFRLPSGADVVPVPDHTPAVVLELRPADGVVNDTPAVRVRLIAGPKKGQEVWVRRSRVVLRSRAAGPGTRPESLLRQARALEKLGKPAQALGFYERLVATFPDAPEARRAAERIDALEPKGDPDDEDAPGAEPARPGRAPEAEAHASP